MGIGLQPYRRQTIPPSRRGYPPAGALPRGVLHDGEDAVFEHMVHDCVHRQHPGYRRIGSTFFTCSRSHPDAFTQRLEVERVAAPDVAV